MVEVLYSEFLRQVDAGEVTAVSFSDSPALGFRRVGSDTKQVFSTVAVTGARDALIAKLSEKGVTFGQVATGGLKRFSSVFILMIPFLYIAAMAYVLMRLHNPKGEAGRRASTGDRSEVTFADVAGSAEAKVELEEIVDIFHNPERYGALGARMPRGVLLVGPPGTGKTLLAKAVAGECQVPFFYASASDFVEVLVGRGAARVRDLFARARREAPCIVFIDELDAVAKARRNAFGGGCEEREQTLDAMLAEMDGFMHGSRDAAGTARACNPVVVIAATNRAEVLDKAILRPGRFDRLVQVGLPDLAGRLAILQLHAGRIGGRLSSDVDLAQVACLAKGLSGAELANVVNEAALLAARAGCDMVRHDHFAQAILRVAKQHMQSTTAEGVQMGAPSSPPINLLLPN